MSFTVDLTQEIYLAEQKTSVNVQAIALIKVRTDEPDISQVIEQLQSKNQLTRAELLPVLHENSAQQSVLRAVELFLDKSASERAELIRIVIEGHLRGLIRQRTFEELVQEPEAISEGMFKTTLADLDRMGLEMVSFTLQGIHRGSS
jgi:flotillin